MKILKIKIAIVTGFEEVKIAGFREVSALESVPQTSGSQKEAV